MNDQFYQHFTGGRALKAVIEANSANPHNGTTRSRAHDRHERALYHGNLFLAQKVGQLLAAAMHAQRAEKIAGCGGIDPEARAEGLRRKGASRLLESHQVALSVAQRRRVNIGHGTTSRRGGRRLARRRGHG